MKAPAFDVAVVGGGTAGVAAAVSASRMGARTLLVERSEVLGGNAANAQVHTICGLYLPAAGDGGGEPVHANPGFPRSFAAGLARAGAAGDPVWSGRVAVLPTEPAGLAAYAAEQAAEQAAPARGLTCWSPCSLVSAELKESESMLGFAGRGGVRARVLVDASGDGALGAAAGAELSMSEPGELQNPSYIFRMGGVARSSLEGTGRMQLSHAIASATRSGELPGTCESVTVRPGLAAGDAWVTLNIPPLEGRDYTPLDDAYRGALEASARKAAEQLEEFLRTTRPGFQAAQITGWPRRIGVRETRRLRGILEVSREDVLEGRRREDEVAVSTWPIELWRDHRRAHFEYGKGACGIPLGALVSRSHPNLGMAGRCISATHEALGSLRVIGTALATGEAIGVAAALAADSGEFLSSIAASEVRRHITRLAEDGGAP